VLDENIAPIIYLRRWAEEKLETLYRRGINLERVFFDPGIGFGKTAPQNLSILRGLEKLFDLPVRVLVGHSRKGFMAAWGSQPVNERDGYSVGVSLKLAGRGVEALRVHEAHLHATAHYANQEVSP
jgi:dihydropteroate synthase